MSESKLTYISKSLRPLVALRKLEREGNEESYLEEDIRKTLRKLGENPSPFEVSKNMEHWKGYGIVSMDVEDRKALYKLSNSRIRKDLDEILEERGLIESETKVNI